MLDRTYWLSFLFSLLTVPSLTACGWLDTDITEDPPVAPHPGPGGFDGGTPQGTSRTLEALTIADEPPPPIAGGTLFYSETFDRIVVSDPDRDVVFIIDAEATDTAAPLAAVELEKGDEPGRISEAGGRFWVVLRSAGAVAAIDPSALGAVRFPVCATPRGVAGLGDEVFVACAGGELVTLDAASGEELRRVVLDPDLRDVVVDGDDIYVSRFRRPTIYRLNVEGVVAKTWELISIGGFEPTSAHQMVRHPDGGVVLVHQYANTSGVPVVAQQNAYGQGGCSAISMLGVAHVAQDESHQAVHGSMAFPHSISVDADGTTVILEGAALNDPNETILGVPDRGFLQAGSRQLLATQEFHVDCHGLPVHEFLAPAGYEFSDGRQLVAVVHSPRGAWVQSRDPWEVVGPGVRISLPGANPKDSGHDLFHERAGAQVACVTCHAEGGDDGLVWRFDGHVARRTHDLRGGISMRAPFHWEGDLEDMGAIMRDSFNVRMNGPLLPPEHLAALEGWIDSIPLPAAFVAADSPEAVEGESIFHREELGCVGCHTPPLFTNNRNEDVGTGGSFQVPSLLGAGHRLAFLHDGCASDLEEAILGLGCEGTGEGHGDVSSLSGADLQQLVAYLSSL